MTTQFNQPPVLQDPKTMPPRVQDSWLAIGGGAAVVLGSLLPFVSFNVINPGVQIGPGYAAVLIGLILAALGIALRAARRPGRLVAGTVILCLSSLFGLYYVILIAVGIHGVQVQDTFGDTSTLTFNPNIGIILALAGCAAAYTAAIRSFHHKD